MSARTKKRLLAAVLAIVLLAGALFAYRKARSLYHALMLAVTEGNAQELQDTEDTIHWIQRGVNELNGVVRAYGERGDYAFDYTWMQAGQAPLIAHALGGIDGMEYTNSLEAFEANYALGYRVFEIDLDLTCDDYTLISSHYEDRWREATGAPADMPYTAENIRSQWAKQGFTVLDGREVIDLLAAYPDVYIVTDTKFDAQPEVALQFSQLTKYALETAPETLDRIIPQIYNMEMLKSVMDIYPFRSVIYTLYNTVWYPESVRLFCENTGIGFVTVSQAQYTDELANELAEIGVHLAVHTINDPAQARSFLDSGVAMLYTDFLSPGDFAG